jgi:hypothetical protein
LKSSQPPGRAEALSIGRSKDPLSYLIVDGKH